jgi:hypothetical protein
MTRDELIQAINDLADSSVKDINKSIPDIQKQMMDEIEGMLRKLDYDGSHNLRRTVGNMKTVANINNKLRRIILSGKYEKSVVEYLKSFNALTALQNQYVRQTIKDFKIKPVLAQLKDQSVNLTIEALTEQGLDSNVISPIRKALQTNITTGGKYQQILQQVREAVLTTPAGEGSLERYVKQITTDSLNQYSRNYLQLATSGSDLKWYQYTGSNIKTTRCFCFAMTKKRFFHASEIPALLKGDFDEFDEMDCPINSKTDLPDGMIPGTNESNFLINLGGYNCGHRAIPVLDIVVPQSIRDKIKKSG